MSDPRSNVDTASVAPTLQPPPGSPNACGRCGRFPWAAGIWRCNGRLDGAPFQSDVSVFAGHGACFVEPARSEAFPGLQVREGACGCSDADNGALRCAYDEEGSRVELACVLVKPTP